MEKQIFEEQGGVTHTESSDQELLQLQIFEGIIYVFGTIQEIREKLQAMTRAQTSLLEMRELMELHREIWEEFQGEGIEKRKYGSWSKLKAPLDRAGFSISHSPAKLVSVLKKRSLPDDQRDKVSEQAISVLQQVRELINEHISDKSEKKRMSDQTPKEKAKNQPDPLLEVQRMLRTDQRQKAQLATRLMELENRSFKKWTELNERNAQLKKIQALVARLLSLEEIKENQALLRRAKSHLPLVSVYALPPSRMSCDMEVEQCSYAELEQQRLYCEHTISRLNALSPKMARALREARKGIKTFAAEILRYWEELDEKRERTPREQAKEWKKRRTILEHFRGGYSARAVSAISDYL